MATQEHTQEDNEARLELAREANLEISMLAKAAADVCQDEDRPIFHGIMARIQTLTEIIFHAQRLHGESDSDWGGPDTEKLQNVFKGLIA